MKYRKIITAVLAGVTAFSAVGISAVNADKMHTVTDVKNLQDFLHQRETADLSGADYDLNDDGIWNVCDLALMKREILNTQDTNNSNEILIAYFTPAENSGTDAISSATLTSWNGEDMGAAEVLANMIHNHTDADMFSIQTTVNYPLEYNELADYAKNEQDNNILPELTSHIENLDNYDTIFVVFPAWWYTMPQAVYSFFDEYDFSGKTIIPAVTHEGSNLAGSPATIQKLEPDANIITNGFSVRFSNVVDAEENVVTWLDSLNLKG